MPHQKGSKNFKVVLLKMAFACMWYFWKFPNEREVNSNIYFDPVCKFFHAKINVRNGSNVGPMHIWSVVNACKARNMWFCPMTTFEEFEQGRSLTKYQVYPITPTVIYSRLQSKRFLKAIKNCLAIFQRNKNPHQLALEKTPLSDVTGHSQV